MDDWLATICRRIFWAWRCMGAIAASARNGSPCVSRATIRDIDVATHEPEFAQWKWLAIEALPRLIVPFKRDTYAKVIAAFRDLAFSQGA